MRAPLSILNGLLEIGTFFEQKKVDTYVCSEDMTREEIAPLGLNKTLLNFGRLILRHKNSKQWREFLNIGLKILKIVLIKMFTLIDRLSSFQTRFRPINFKTFFFSSCKPLE